MKLHFKLATQLLLPGLVLVLVAACATDTGKSSSNGKRAPVTEGRPSDSFTNTPAKPAEPGFTEADGEQITLALETHRTALLTSDVSSLPANEAGYYLDTLEARMIQMLRDTPVRYERRDNQFEMLFASGNSFATNTAQLTNDAVSQLHSIVNLLIEYDRTQVLIFGHTDDVGEADYNQVLSSRRAIAVARVLVDAGVQPERILVAGFGEYRPIADNSTEAGRALNRRVELVIEPIVR